MLTPIFFFGQIIRYNSLILNMALTHLRKEVWKWGELRVGPVPRDALAREAIGTDGLYLNLESLEVFINWQLDLWKWFPSWKEDDLNIIESLNSNEAILKMYYIKTRLLREKKITENNQQINHSKDNDFRKEINDIFRLTRKVERGSYCSWNCSWTIFLWWTQYIVNN